MKNISNWKKFNESSNYGRVLPRDLFNEAKLLKCIGRLCLLIHDDKGLGITFTYNDMPFDIRQNTSDGSLSIENIKFEYNNTPLNLSTRLNSKAPYPLELSEESIDVFEDNGEFTQDFKDYLTSVS